MQQKFGWLGNPWLSMLCSHFPLNRLYHTLVHLTFQVQLITHPQPPTSMPWHLLSTPPGMIVLPHFCQMKSPLLECHFLHEACLDPSIQNKLFLPRFSQYFFPDITVQILLFTVMYNVYACTKTFISPIRLERLVGLGLCPSLGLPQCLH